MHFIVQQTTRCLVVTQEFSAGCTFSSEYVKLSCVSFFEIAGRFCLSLDGQLTGAEEESGMTCNYMISILNPLGIPESLAGAFFSYFCIYQSKICQNVPHADSE